MDEFTFPTVPRGQCKLPLFPQLSSPPPWFVAAAADDAPWSGCHGEEEKMDMLWEDFNEELARTPPVCPLNKGGLMMEAWFVDVVDDDGVGVAAGVVVDPEKRRKLHASSVVRRRRWSLLLMLKLLKKLFLVKKSRNNPRTAPI